MYSLNSFIWFLLFAGIQTQDFEDPTQCPDPSTWVGKLDSYQVQNWPDRSKPCNLVKGTDHGINITFTPLEKIEGVTTFVKGIVAGIAVDFKVPEPDACVDSGFRCPIDANQSVNYKTKLSVLQAYPTIKLKVRWALLDNQKRTIVCVMIPVHITNDHHRHH